MKYYGLEPEVAGSLGAGTVMDRDMHPPRVHRLEYVFDGWLGDDIVETFPCFIVTARLKKAIEGIRPTGLAFDEVKVSKSKLFEELYGNRALPQFYWLRISGRPGADDFGMEGSPRYRLVVSERVLQVLRQHQLSECSIKEYQSAEDRPC